MSEAGFCSETMFEDKLKEKELQHKHLQEALSAYRFEVDAVLTTLGVYGTGFTINVKWAQMLGVERVRARCSMNALHAHAITSLQAEKRI